MTITIDTHTRSERTGTGTLAGLHADKHAGKLRATAALKQLAAEYGVCTRPVTIRRIDTGTGETEWIDQPCQATLETKCPSCAKKARRLRQVQIRQGWHRPDEPAPPPEAATEGQISLVVLRAHLEHARSLAELHAEWDQLADIDTAIDEVEQAINAEGLRGMIAPPHDSNPDDDEDGEEAGGHRRVRSTKRRQDAPDLPRQPIQPVTVGRTYTAPDGRVFQPSMWLTLTLDSYGPVHSIHTGRPCGCGRRHAENDPELGTPVDPDTYDYRKAAWDAVHFPRLLDRFWQNLRRTAGWNIQYAGSVEPQRRLAPHAHFAIRGTLPRAMLHQVAAATYHQVWWPAVDEPVYLGEELPRWEPEVAAWVDPRTGALLTTWEQALDALDADEDAEPVHVARFGPQVKAKGVTADSKDAKRTIGYITKYLTKTVDACHPTTGDAQREHLDRWWRQLRVTPCSDRCANWLLYGIQPKKAHSRLRPGACKGRVHQKPTLGIGGRRVLVSRDWSGKTLAEHRHDARAWVKALLGITDKQQDGDGEGAAPVVWELARPDDPDLPPLQHRLLRAISLRIQHRQQLAAARQHPPPGEKPPERNVSAIPSTAVTQTGEGT